MRTTPNRAGAALAAFMLAMSAAGCFFEEDELPEGPTPTPEPTATPAPTNTPEGPKQVGEGKIEVETYFHQTTKVGDDVQGETGSVEFTIMRDADYVYSLVPKGIGQFTFAETVISSVCSFDAEADGFYHVSGTLDTRAGCSLRVDIAATYNLMQFKNVTHCPASPEPFIIPPHQYETVVFPLEKNHTVSRGVTADEFRHFKLVSLTLDSSVPCQIEGN
jgi:hypothetical protein